MARPLRMAIPGGLYHVTSRGLECRAIVADERERRRWLDLLDAVTTRRLWRVLAWVLMDNRSQLFVRTLDAGLSAGRHEVSAGYATELNRPVGGRLGVRPRSAT